MLLTLLQPGLQPRRCFFPRNDYSLPAGVEGLREIIVEGYRPSVARAYSEEDAAQHFAHFAGGRAVVVVVAEGPQAIADATAEGVERIDRVPSTND